MRTLLRRRIAALVCGVPIAAALVATTPRTTNVRLLPGASLVAPDVTGIREEACLDAAARMQQVSVPVSPQIHPQGAVTLSLIHWPATTRPTGPPLLLVHGFDSSCLEYRRVGPLLAAQGVNVYAVDILGWGFTQLEGVSTFGADAKVAALQSLITTLLGGDRPFCVAGASLGGAAAIEVAATSPNCQGLVLLDAQGFVDGIGPMAKMPTPLAKIGAGVLRSVPLRSSANQMSYFDKKTFATEDALAIGRAHCLREGWDDALVSFMQSGGFSPSAKVPTIRSPTLVLWGRQDKVLDPAEFVPKFMEALPDATLQWIEECGHVPHLEQPVATADAIVTFLNSLGKGDPAERPGATWVAPLVGLSALAAYAADFLPVH